MAIHESGQMYLETIYILRQTKSFAAVQAHLEQVTKMREDAHGQ